jgi:PAB-dependent poly(A)-specific ribonuclease subunit 3
MAIAISCVVFHQADGAGRPVMDLGHVVTSLNKLDAADEEKIVLSSRDGKSIFIVSYADVALCLDNAFNELCAGAVLPGALQY